MEVNKIYNGNCLEVLKTFPDNSIDCCITSPPYYGLRDYGMIKQIGLEETPELYIEKLVQVFTEVKRVLKPEGTLWLNLGDSYCTTPKGNIGTGLNGLRFGANEPTYNKSKLQGLKNKDLIGIPWMAAFALRSDGWYLRQDIIWSKPNPMPESVTDRCTKSHEYIFLLSKSSKYYYDADAIKEGDAIYIRKATPNKKLLKRSEAGSSYCSSSSDKNGFGRDITTIGANKRSVWTVTTNPYADAHFATYPQTLITDCIKAGCPENGIILDPFMGAGTTALVASKLHRNFVGIELNPEYIKIAENRLRKELGMFNTLNT